MRKLLCLLMIALLMPCWTLAEEGTIQPIDMPNLTVTGSDKVIVSDFALIPEGSRSQLVIAFTNVSEETIPYADFQIVFYDESGAILGQETDAHDVFLPGSTVVTQKGIYSETVPNYASVEVIVDTESHTNHYINHAENLDITDNVSGNSVFLQIVNKDTVQIAEIEIVVVFYKDGQIVGVDEDQTTGLEVDEKVVMEFSGYERSGADSYKYFINQAHTWW